MNQISASVVSNVGPILPVGTLNQNSKPSQAKEWKER